MIISYTAVIYCANLNNDKKLNKIINELISYARNSRLQVLVPAVLLTGL
jgi:hypothetical protein